MRQFVSVNIENVLHHKLCTISLASKLLCYVPNCSVLFKFTVPFFISKVCNFSVSMKFPSVYDHAPSPFTGTRPFQIQTFIRK